MKWLPIGQSLDRVNQSNKSKVKTIQNNNNNKSKVKGRFKSGKSVIQGTEKF